MAAHLRQVRAARRRMRVPRVLRDRTNPLESLDEEEVFIRFRFRPHSILLLVGLLNMGACPTLRNNPLPPLLQVLVCLRFLATGAMHLLIGDSLNLSRSTTGRCIRSVALAVSRLAPQFVRFPTGDRATKAKKDFGSVAGFPNVVGCVDGTFIRIIRPSLNEADFVNRKGYHSLNVQMCCDAQYRITSCNASWPGSVHDSRIFRTSALNRNFENGNYTGLLLGDSGYPCRWFLMTPLLNPATPAEDRFNTSLCRTRVIIEQTFGILKRRFQCLHNELITSPAQAVTYVLACVVLHNFGIENNDVFRNADNDNGNVNNINVVIPHDRQDGADVRRHLINTFFSQ